MNLLFLSIKIGNLKSSKLMFIDDVWGFTSRVLQISYLLFKNMKGV